MPHFLNGSAPKLHCHPRSYCRCGNDGKPHLEKQFDQPRLYITEKLLPFVCQVANTRGSLLSEQRVVHHGRASGLNVVLMTAGKTGTSAVKRADLEEPAVRDFAASCSWLLSVQVAACSGAP